MTPEEITAIEAGIKTKLVEDRDRVSHEHALRGAGDQHPDRRLGFGQGGHKGIGGGKGGYWEDRGYEWYAGI